MTHWTIERTRETYNLGQWGGGYFDVDEAGHLLVRPDPEAAKASIDLHALSTRIHEQGLSLPVLVRFTGILRHRVETLRRVFASAINEYGFEGAYTPVYPIKVNQQRSVVEAIIGDGFANVGMEAGSKPELLAVLALASQDRGVIVCNGYKDREYIRLALIGTALGHQVYIVVEKLSELELVIEESRKMAITPLVGVRMRLASIGAGKWQNTGGEKSKFGLSSAQVLAVVERLRSEQLLGSLGMMHFHMGSQIANIRHIQLGMREAGRYYSELIGLGAPVRYVNVGGGLGVDYEGTRSRNFFSANYSVQEYANNIVHALSDICKENGLPHPHIVTEAGRAMTAHHAVLVTNVVEVEQIPGFSDVPPAGAEECGLVQDMWQALSQINQRSAIETYHDAVNWMSEAQDMFGHGIMNLSERARAEQLYFAICHKVRDTLSYETRAHREVIDELNEKLADKYFCNFSLFQSLPDAWAIGQIFPIVPLGGLTEAPTQRGVLVDITCDSDGRINHYVDSHGAETSLPLHKIKRDEPYLLGIFLVGAYQEILGDMHNLFGDTDSINVEIKDGKLVLDQAQRGDDVASVLRYVHFNPEDLLASYRKKITGTQSLSDQEREKFLQELADGMEGYTYLED
ncbi:MAG: biosynthetic arginine decarboxylase [Gammaproteobacteria bacterium]|nr:biosynthetic arginine decarboxylase [Gammaproteobacteria bacterium]